MRRQQFLQRIALPKLQAGFRPNLTGMILICHSLIIGQCFRTVAHLGHTIDFRDEKLKKNSFLKPQGI